MHIFNTKDTNKMMSEAWDIYNRYQATMAGQLNDDLDDLQDKFNEIVAELGVAGEDLWNRCENEHALSQLL